MKNKILLLSITIILAVAGCKEQSTNPGDNNSEKQALKGLVTMGSVRDLRNDKFDVLKEANTHQDIYSGVVIRATWGKLEPQRGTFDFSSIQNALNDIKNYNNLHPNHKLGAKLRISATINPPDWILNLADGPVEVVINETLSYNIGLFWTEEYRQAWRELQVKLAEAFDADTLIREVCISSPAMATDEPFVTIFNQATIKNLHEKGFTDAAFKQALEGTLDDYSCWEKTSIDFSFNTYREIDTGVPVNDTTFAINLMKTFKNRYGKRAVLSNHGLQENLTKGALSIYRTFPELGGAIAAQTKAPKDLTDQTFRVGLSFGVSEFEIWDSRAAGGYADFNMNDLQRWKEIINN
jgi:hypothetical protein